MPDYNAIHTYCQVAFDDSGKSFYYRTRNPELKVGDMVYVPVGYKYEKKSDRLSQCEIIKEQKPHILSKGQNILLPKLKIERINQACERDTTRT